MKPNPKRLAAVLLGLSLALPAFAQAPGGGSSAGKGTSADGSGPADGAIKGGSILPGETAGMPSTTTAKSRCADLTGTLKEQCQEQESSASGGGTRLPEVGAAKPAPPREAPPPQNPRPLN